ncbi:ATP-grasp domain protein [Leptospira inadai serovar Lyme str. 10]|uniref:ATP-grasp domain protein n=2 Tax=Leptospira inadai serovar Lyme TaxID=293084 RepID=V6HC18_9LEPT|nr:carboxylate--amine ligase [Leptospira inadai]EQA36298.1 ATP-grasp domain protein [Leptospira inadai serovar Lyme str. 10]PNV75509.1 carboxylate--amine ligase [Leptospira inadai serovar Lyme]
MNSDPCEEELLKLSNAMEFWPTWRLYLPLIPWIALLSFRSIRLGSLTSLGFGTIAAANPGIPLGGLVGESKFEILRRLKQDYVLKNFLVDIPFRTSENILAQMKKIGLDFPIIIKPDAGQRGQGVRLATRSEELPAILSESNVPLLVQEFHPGPNEAGIFYYRLPSEPSGKIFSITRKAFPRVTGDGRSTLEDLIRMHPRFRIQAKVFRERFPHRWAEALPKGYSLKLAEAGNHCQGALFLDGKNWITPQLEKSIEDATRPFTGFYFGRYDVRFSSVEELKSGKGFKIIELNGVTSESTNLYDPRFSMGDRYAILFKQWQLLFKIGRESGGKKAGLFPILRAIWDFYKGDRKVSDLSN